ncbi:MAG: tRNA pseudouridine(38-40) synthase TruA [Armatimonadetes bacterium]|nr:tRNA pseudouridine(38-40) synthase TruA [Armatimonadota bacterium]
MRNVKATIEYDGTGFFGFQKQSSVRTVQGELEYAAASVFGERVSVIGAGRTDAGVHAVGQVVSFKVPGPIPTANLVCVLNDRMPADLCIRRCVEVDESFHARRSALSRTYVYTVLSREEPAAILGRYAWQVSKPLDVDLMQEAAQALVGTRDFASFGMPMRIGESTVRRVIGVGALRQGDAIRFVIKANAFLRGMARAIVGALVEVGQGKRRIESLPAMIEACDRRAAGVIAPPQGLCLTKVEY